MIINQSITLHHLTKCRKLIRIEHILNTRTCCCSYISLSILKWRYCPVYRTQHVVVTFHNINDDDDDDDDEDEDEDEDADIDSLSSRIINSRHGHSFSHKPEVMTTVYRQ